MIFILQFSTTIITPAFGFFEDIDSKIVIDRKNNEFIIFLHIFNFLINKLVGFKHPSTNNAPRQHDFSTLRRVFVGISWP